ncbi:DUF2231 domain-containing protein [Telluria aromaticivorans]|uniref:DUF2231 domain-containing protein n=1 Tax=Telluria aromaticivorans TaxID=2725995 RepID=A0A7Y2JXT4_9BURK|nr:DUF2231 domain-containing protein [Telluria aromaticivorans]NNG22338.1 hypothetical protein [Telluria aromaticivorans]
MPSVASATPAYRSSPGPLHAILLGGSVSLFLGAMLSDIAYYQTHQIQWSNFASWLNAAGMVFCGVALAFALVNLLRARQKGGQPLTYFVVLLAAFVLGLFTAFQHAKDAWAIMPAALVMSIIVLILILAAAWIGLSARTGGAE